jgi:rod shape-determining protein MreB
VISESVRVAGDELTNAIMQYMKKEHNLIIGERTAEDIKIRLGSAYPSKLDDEKMEVRGLHLVSGLPKTITIIGIEIRECLEEAIAVVIDAVKRTLERIPPELAADIIDRGIMLAGGGALLKGMDTRVSQEMGIVTHIAEDPLRCVVKGTGEVLKSPKLLERIISDSVRGL